MKNALVAGVIAVILITVGATTNAHENATGVVKERMDLMQKNNPAIIPRNHQVEQALSSATDGNLSPFHSLLQALNNPYNNSRELESYQCPPKPHQRIKNTFCGT